MNYLGTIIEESLSDTSVLGKVKILSTAVEQVEESHQTPWLKKWTPHKIEIPGDKAQEIAEIISNSIDQSHDSSWYADYKNTDWHYIIFPHQIFKIDRKMPEQYTEARNYGISLGIPGYQVDFSPETN